MDRRLNVARVCVWGGEWGRQVTLDRRQNAKRVSRMYHTKSPPPLLRPKSRGAILAKIGKSYYKACRVLSPPPLLIQKNCQRGGGT